MYDGSDMPIRETRTTTYMSVPTSARSENQDACHAQIVHYPSSSLITDRTGRTVIIWTRLIWNGSFSSPRVDLTSMWYRGQRPCHAAAFSGPNHSRVSCPRVSSYVKSA